MLSFSLSSCELIDDLECHPWMARMNTIVSNKLSKEIEDIPSSPFNMQHSMRSKFPREQQNHCVNHNDNKRLKCHNGIANTEREYHSKAYS